MSAQLLWLDYSQKARWQEVITMLPLDKQDIYFSPEYLELYANENTKANCYVFIEKDNIYMYPFMKGNVPGAPGYFDMCTPYGYGGPVANTVDPNFIRLAYEIFYDEAIKQGAIAEVIKFHPLLDNRKSLMDIYHGNILKTCSTIYVDLKENEDVLWSDVYTHANRKNINKARRIGMEVHVDQGEDAWKAFLNLYEETLIANQAVGFYFFTPEYYKNLREKLVGQYTLVSCWLENHVIAVMLVLQGKTMAHCHLLGIDRKFLSSGVGNYLHHELIAWCRAKGYQFLHIGGGRTNDENDPLLSFKKNFSNEIADFYIGESILNEEVYHEVCDRWENENAGRQQVGRLLKYRY